MQQLYPDVKVDEDKIFVKDGAIWSSAGVTACIDLSLALVEADLGAEISKKIARLMVVYHRCSGGQSQFSAMTELEPGSDRIRQALQFAKAIEKLRIEEARELIEQGHTSVSHIANLTGFGDEERMRRAFIRVYGQSPKVFVQQVKAQYDSVYIN